MDGHLFQSISVLQLALLVVSAIAAYRNNEEITVATLVALFICSACT